ncbi:broad specificity phosphatase PhoE [Kineosphaera limosa]|uniref:Phosphoglycerate mutase family protein n=1 Tax=Kineosphaera limosa NBRC 100340 TaxID=1184609 RepID=K6VJS3_9MICO|nr:histidine phosphatase family protein [Kineosphaera limosa]NYE01734.1 broad specificity phosphatase PhoE [Kineosphaera limosa]GAB96468.1 phosphoglycerate mutase family protein [Kineosphaera limosa NBRC 100340]
MSTPSSARVSLRRDVVHLLRHGEVHNPDGILYGRLADFHLSDRGRAMADLVAEHLADAPIGMVTASSLDRAQQTAAPIAAAHGLGVHTDDRVIEAGNHFEGKTFGRGAGSPANPANWALLRNPLRPSWGEPYEQIVARMLAAIRAARAAVHELYDGGEIVIVSHQLPIETTRRFLEGQHLWHDPRRRQCTLASLTTLTFHGDALESIAYSEPAAALLPGAAQVPGA